MSIRFYLVSFFLFLSACASDVQDLVGDPNFNLTTLNQAVIVIADVDAGTSNIQNIQVVDRRNIAVTALRKSRSDLKVFNANALQSQLGEASFSQAVAASKNQFANDADKNLLAEMAASADLVLFARIMADDESQTESEEVAERDNRNVRILTRESQRNAAMQVDIYSTETQQLVWSALVDKQLSETTSEERANGSFLENLAVDVIEAALLPNFPPPPSDIDMLTALFKKLGASLPQRSCKELGFGGCMKRAWEQG